MLSDKQLYELTQEIIDIAREIEMELILSIASRLDVNDEVGGTAYWQLKQLNEMGSLHEESIRIIAKYSNKSIEEVERMIKSAGIASIDFTSLDKVFELGLTTINPKSINIMPVIEAYQRAIEEETRMILTSAITESNIKYQRMIDKVALEVTGGFKSYDQAIQSALNDLADKGIVSTRYEGMNIHGEPYVIEYPIEASIRRTAMTAINQVANKANEQIIDELKPPQIAVSAHIGARNKGIDYENHEKWQGKIYDNDGTFEKKTGYNSGDMLGLGGYNCRHIHWAYWEGISVEPEPVPQDDDRYDNEQRQRLLERRVRDSKKRIEVAKQSEDKEYIQREKKLLDRRLKALDEHCKTHGLVRQYARERIAKNYKPKE